MPLCDPRSSSGDCQPRVDRNLPRHLDRSTRSWGDRCRWAASCDLTTLRKSPQSLTNLDAVEPVQAAELMLRGGHKTLGYRRHINTGQVIALARLATSLGAEDMPSQRMLSVELGPMSAGIELIGIVDQTRPHRSSTPPERTNSLDARSHRRPRSPAGANSPYWARPSGEASPVTAPASPEGLVTSTSRSGWSGTQPIRFACEPQRRRRRHSRCAKKAYEYELLSQVSTG